MSTTDAASQKAAPADEEKSKGKGDETSSSTRSDDRSTAPAAATIKLDEETQTEQHNAKKGILSEEAKQRAQVLLERLTREIENRIKISNAIYPHTSEHDKDSSRFSQSLNKSSNDPFTTERPPKPHRRSSEQRPTSPQDEWLLTLVNFFSAV